MQFALLYYIFSQADPAAAAAATEIYCWILLPIMAHVRRTGTGRGVLARREGRS